MLNGKLASAPDLDEIIGGSDDENVDLFGPSGQLQSSQNVESITLPDLIKRFRTIWQNEKLSPELMVAQTDAIALINRELVKFESQAKGLPKGDIRAQLMRMQAERLRYLLTDYLRIRIRKIEQYPHHVLMEERSRPQSEEPHLTPAEFNFVKAFNNTTTENLRTVVLNHLPINMRKLEPETIAFRPNLDSYVFCKVNSRVDTTETGPTLTLIPGEIHLLPYRAIRKHIDNGAVTLL